MARIYDRAEDKNVAAIVIYGKGSDGKAGSSTGTAATATLVSVAD